mgnify:CR=1 FL=1
MGRNKLKHIPASKMLDKESYGQMCDKSKQYWLYLINYKLVEATILKDVWGQDYPEQANNCLRAVVDYRRI